MEATPTTAPTTSAPAATEAPAPSAPPATRAQSLIEKINATLQASRGAPAADQPADEGADGEAATEQPAGEPTTEPEGRVYAHQLAAAMQKAQRAESEALKQRTAFEAQAKQLAELQAVIEGAKADPVKALALANMDPAALAEMMLQGKLKAPEPKLELPPEVQQLIEEGKAAKAREAKAAADAQAAEFRAQNLKTIEGLMSQAANDFPLVAALPGVHERLLNGIELHVAEHGEEPDFRTVLQDAQAVVLKEAAALMGNKAALAIMLKDDAVKATVMEVLGLLSTPPAEATKQPVPGKQAHQGSPTKTLTSKVTAAVPSRTTKSSTTADLVARINRDLLNRG